MRSAYVVTVDPESTQGSVSLGGEHSFTERRRSPVSIEVAESLIDAFASLPPGGGDLCFDPVFVIEIRDGDSVQWAGGACLDCGTYSSTDGFGPPEGSFDQNSRAASELLNRLGLLS